MLTIVSFIFALGLLIFLHEGGHFLAARMCGVTVQRFSIGFGRPILKWVDSKNTEWVIGWIPLGGYVSMLGERDGNVTEDQKQYTFSGKSIGQRAFIIGAGPAANFIAAWFFFSALLATPHESFIPTLGPTYKSSIAEYAGFKQGDLVIEADGKEVLVMEDWQEALMSWAVVAEKSMMIKVRTNEGKVEERVLPELKEPIQPIEGWTKALGWAHFGSLDGTPVLEAVSPKGSFGMAGLLKGDVIKAINNKETKTWTEFMMAIASMPNETVKVDFVRDDKLMSKEILIEAKTINRVTFGVAGITTPQPQMEKKRVWLGFWESSWKGVERTIWLSKLTLQGMGQLLTGAGSADQVSGPIGIAEHAGQSAERGLSSFVSFLGLLSVSLGILNLLPIPLLDGGHLFFLLIEKLKGSPIPIEWEKTAISFGFFIIASLSVMGILNDARKLMGF